MILILLCCSIKVIGKLPQVQVSLSDQRIVDIVKLALSIALPDAALPDSDYDSDSDYQVLYIIHRLLQSCADNSYTSIIHQLMQSS